MKLFLDTSVILAASGRAAGASHFIFEQATLNRWRLLVSHYVLREVDKNLPLRLPVPAWTKWSFLRQMVEVVGDELTYPWPVVFGTAKDKPILFTAAAVADVLLTLDRGDFESFFTNGFYGLLVTTPGNFLREERTAGRLISSL